MLLRSRTYVLAFALVVLSLPVAAQSAGRVMAVDELSAASKRTTAQTVPTYSRGTLRTAPVSNRPLGGTVGPDNYQYWHQACCL
jgi:hypothetical protein